MYVVAGEREDKVTEWEVEPLVVSEVEPYDVVKPYSTDAVDDSFVEKVIVAPEVVREEAEMEEMMGAVVSGGVTKPALYKAKISADERARL